MFWHKFLGSRSKSDNVGCLATYGSPPGQTPNLTFSLSLLDPSSPQRQKVIGIKIYKIEEKKLPLSQASWQGKLCLVSMALALRTNDSSCSWCSTGSENGDRFGSAGASASARAGGSPFSRPSRPSTWQNHRWDESDLRTGKICRLIQGVMLLINLIILIIGIIFFPESMRVLPAELFLRTAAKNWLEDDSLIGTTSATINFKSIAHKHPTSNEITKSITSRGLPAFLLLPSRKDQLYGTPNLWPFGNDPYCFYQIPHHVP